MTLMSRLMRSFALSDQGAKDLIKGCASCVLANLVLMLPVILLYFLVLDLMAGGVPQNHVLLYAVGTVVVLILIFLTTWIQYNATYFATYVESGVRRVSIAEKLRKLPLSFFGKKDLPDLTSRIMSDCAYLEQVCSHYIPELIGACISTIFVAVGLFFFDWRMALAAVWVLPVAFFIVLFSTKVQIALSRKLTDVKMACADGIQEYLETMRDLLSNNAENAYLAGLDEKIKAVEKRSIISELGVAVFVVSAHMILKFGIATTALAGSVLLVGGNLNVVVFFMFLLVVSRIYDPLQGALNNLAAVIASRVRVERMNEIFDCPVQSGTQEFHPSNYDIVFENVGFSYKKGEQVLHDVSFTAKQGEVTALIGPSGGGKTTVSRLAARFWDCTKGRVTVGGIDIAAIEPETLLSYYSIVFQDVLLFNNSVLENIRIGRKDATDEEVLEAARFAHCSEFAEKLPDGWNTLIGENGSELSGGERQRISIARAFLKNAPIILLDEATASLDVENETQIQDALSHLIAGKTVLLIAHRMRTVSGADKIVVLENGRVCETGTPENLYSFEGVYRRMADMQRCSPGHQKQGVVC